jgi:cation:H+ antiporter
VTTAATALDLTLLAVAVAALWLGAQRFVESAARIARRLGLSELVIGLTIVAVGTSAPEAAVTLDAAVTGRPTIAVANVIGSNLFNLGLVLGLVAVVRTVAGSRSLVRRDGAVVVLGTLALAVLVRDGTVGRLEGVALLAGFLGYLALLFRGARGKGRPTAGSHTSSIPAPVWLVVGFVLIVGGANLLVASAADLARVLGASEFLIGETVVAVGTSTPEVAASVAAAREGLGDIAAGNLVGSSVFNVLGVLGLAAVVVPLPAGTEAASSLVWLSGLTVLAVALLATGRELSRVEGAVLAAVTLVKWAIDLL